MSMAESFYPTDSVKPQTHHEAISGGIGLVVGSIAAGPLGAIIGGSMGVMAGNQQSKTETITSQQHSISRLEQDLEHIMAELAQSKITTQTAQSTIEILESDKQDSQQQHRAEQIQFANSYQFDIYFMTNSHSITHHSQQGLIKLAQLLQENEHIYANIEAHSDWRGSDDANCLLARQRLSAVTQHLIEAGGHQDQLLATSYGEHANSNQGVWGDELFYDRRVTISLNYFE